MVDTSKTNADLIREEMGRVRSRIASLQEKLKGLQVALDIVEKSTGPRAPALPKSAL